MSPRRGPAGVAALLVSAGLLAGCTGGGAGGAATPASAATSPASPTSSDAGPVSLRFSVYGAPETVAAYKDMATAYTREHPNVTVHVEHTRDAEAATAHLEQQVRRGSEPDVFLTDHAAVPALVRDGDLQPVDELLEQRGMQFGEDFQRVGLEAFSADSSLQCMPDNISPLVVYYNTDLLRLRSLVPRGEEPPTLETGWTWDQFSEAARKTSKGGVDGVYIPPTLTALTPLVRSAGADVVNDERTPTALTMDDADTRDALEKVLTLMRDPRVTPTRQQLASQDAVSRFKAGKIAMMVGTRELVPQLRTAARLHFDVFQLPNLGEFRTASDMSGLCISAKSPKIEAAADFITFAVSRRGAELTARSGTVVPTNVPALHSAAFIQPGRPPASVNVFSDSVRRSDSSPFVPRWTDVLERTGPLVDTMFYAPVLNLDRLLPRMDAIGERILAPTTASPSPSP